MRCRIFSVTHDSEGTLAFSQCRAMALRQLLRCQARWNIAVGDTAINFTRQFHVARPFLNFVAANFLFQVLIPWLRSKTCAKVCAEQCWSSHSFSWNRGKIFATHTNRRRRRFEVGKTPLYNMRFWRFFFKPNFMKDQSCSQTDPRAKKQSCHPLLKSGRLFSNDGIVHFCGLCGGTDM
jgi:hypothetical protein